LATDETPRVEKHDNSRLAWLSAIAIGSRKVADTKEIMNLNKTQYVLDDFFSCEPRRLKAGS
jgi:hypothetical protein